MSSLTKFKLCPILHWQPTATLLAYKEHVGFRTPCSAGYAQVSLQNLVPLLFLIFGLGYQPAYLLPYILPLQKKTPLN